MAGRMDMMYSKKRRRRGPSAFYIFFAVILTVLAVIISLSAFFRVQNMAVEGNTYYTDEELLAASGIEEGDNLVFLNQSDISRKLHDTFLCVDNVQVKRTLPGTVTLVVTESTPAGYVRYGGSCWIINESCRLLEETDEVGVKGLIEIRGMNLTEPVVGEIIKTDDTSGLLTEYLSETLKQAVKQEIAGDITYIDVTSITSIEFGYTNRFTVKLGRGENVEMKFKNLLAVTAELTRTDRGTIDITDEKETHFKPD